MKLQLIRSRTAREISRAPIRVGILINIDCSQMLVMTNACPTGHQQQCKKTRRNAVRRLCSEQQSRHASVCGATRARSFLVYVFAPILAPEFTPTQHRSPAHELTA